MCQSPLRACYADMRTHRQLCDLVLVYFSAVQNCHRSIDIKTQCCLHPVRGVRHRKRPHWAKMKDRAGLSASPEARGENPFSCLSSFWRLLASCGWWPASTFKAPHGLRGCPCTASAQPASAALLTSRDLRDSAGSVHLVQHGLPISKLAGEQM